MRVIAVDRPGCGSWDFQQDRRLLEWPDDVSEMADALKLGQFAIYGHSFGGPCVAVCAHQLADRVTSAAIVAGISPLSFDGATRGMPALVRLVLWLGGHAPVVLRPYVSLMARMVKKPDTIAKGIGSLLSTWCPRWALQTSARGDRSPPWSGSRRQCHLLLFVPLQFPCQIPCQPNDKQPVTRRDEELPAGYGRLSLRSSAL